MSKLAAALLCVAVAVPFAGASAQEISDLTSVWTGISSSVVRGNPPHHQSTEPAGEVRISERDFAMTIEGQEGRTFWGAIGSADTTEGIVGAIAADGRTIHIADTDSYAQMILLEPNLLDVCYVLASTEVQVASCHPLTRAE